VLSVPFSVVVPLSRRVHACPRSQSAGGRDMVFDKLLSLMEVV